MTSDLLAKHLVDVAKDHGYHQIDSVVEEDDRYILTTVTKEELVVFKDNIHVIVKS